MQASITLESRAKSIPFPKAKAGGGPKADPKTVTKAKAKPKAAPEPVDPPPAVPKRRAVGKGK